MTLRHSVAFETIFVATLKSKYTIHEKPFAKLSHWTLSRVSIHHSTEYTISKRSIRNILVFDTSDNTVNKSKRRIEGEGESNVNKIV